jgi:hypothetical protein
MMPLLMHCNEMDLISLIPIYRSEDTKEIVPHKTKFNTIPITSDRKEGTRNR